MLKFGNAFKRTIWFASYNNLLKLQYLRGFELTWLSIKQQCEIFGRDCADIFFFRLKTSFWCLENCPWKVRWRQRQVKSHRHLSEDFIFNGRVEFISSLRCLWNSIQQRRDLTAITQFVGLFMIVLLSLYHLESLIFASETTGKIPNFM